MKGIILAAGRGSRLENQTENKPKCLTKLAGKTLLDWQVSALNEVNITDIYIVRGYLKNCINFNNLKYIDNDIWNKTNMVYSLFLADKILKNNTCIISYSDIVYHPTIIKKLINITADVSLTYDLLWNDLWEERFEDPLSDAETFIVKDNKLIDIGKKAKKIEEIQGQYMGLIKITPLGWKKIKNQLQVLLKEDIYKIDITSFLQLIINSNEVEVMTVGIKGKWCEADYLSDLKLYEEKLLNGKDWKHDWRW